MKILFIAFLLLSSTVFAQERRNINPVISASRSVLARTFGQKIASAVHLDTLQSPDLDPVYSYEVKNGELMVRGSTSVALCKGFYDYLKTTNQGMVTWSGRNVHIRMPWTDVQKKTVHSPYQFHYYFNVVTHGYTTPYWGFDRWERELDWMSLHGMDMPLVNGAYEAILIRVFKKLGLKDAELKAFFTGPAYHPWNRMGNITGWDGEVPASYYRKQVQLTHQVLDRMKELGMHPILPAFAGFVPAGIEKLFPDTKLKEIIWDGFSQLKKNRSHILLPDNKLFGRIGTLYIQEWEKEFGKGKYYLADSFNEMDVPAAPSETALLGQLSRYGNVVYESIHRANADAVWVMQGWTFPYFKGSDGKLFWTENRLAKLVEQVPDDKLLFLDLANEYNHDFWKTDPSWKTYHGFFKKAWVYSFIPDMGGKTPWNGILKTYAEQPAEALAYAKKGNLVGFGFAPEGIENNEIIYELLSDVGWERKKIDLDPWIRSYCMQRYGAYPAAMQEAYTDFLNSCYGTFTDHPRFRYQQNAKGDKPGSVNNADLFFKGVREFLSCSTELEGSQLYKNDALELSAQFLSLKADSLIGEATVDKKAIRYEQLGKAYKLMNQADQLLASYPNHQLETWINLARGWGDSPAEKSYYEKDAKRLITTWGGTVNDYAARMWSGLIDTYYTERMKFYFQGLKSGRPADISAWEEHWIQSDTPHQNSRSADPIQLAVQYISAEGIE